MIRSWNAGALTSYAAIRGRVQDDGRIFLSELISGLVVDTPPNGSLLGRVLRDANVWLAAGKVTAARRQEPDESDHWNQFSQFGLAIENHAERENVRTVGERHIAKFLIDLGQTNRFARLGLNPQTVYEHVRKLELGPEFTDADLKGWHGLIDTNTVLKSRKKLWEIPWREISAAKTGPVTIWISTVTLHELDTLPLYHRESWVREKARGFAVWFNERLKSPADFHEIALTDEVRFKFWKALPGITPDSQILDSANSLRDKGLDIVVVTHDMELRLRALDDDFKVADLPSRLLLDASSDPPTT